MKSNHCFELKWTSISSFSFFFFSLWISSSTRDSITLNIFYTFSIITITSICLSIFPLSNSGFLLESDHFTCHCQSTKLNCTIIHPFIHPSIYGSEREDKFGHLICFFLSRGRPSRTRAILFCLFSLKERKNAKMWWITFNENKPWEYE